MIALWFALALAEPLDCDTLTPLVQANVPAESLARTLAESGTEVTPDLLRCVQSAGASEAYVATLSGEVATEQPALREVADAPPPQADAEPVPDGSQPPTSMPTGRVEDGSTYVYMAYGLTWMVLLGYAGSLLLRRRHVGEG